jgi:hypothetical protein
MNNNLTRDKLYAIDEVKHIGSEKICRSRCEERVNTISGEKGSKLRRNRSFFVAMLSLC